MVKLSRLWLVAGLCALGWTTLVPAPVDLAETTPEPAAESSEIAPTPPTQTPGSCETLDAGVVFDPARIFLAEGGCPKTCSAPYGPSCNDRWDCEEYCSDPGPQGGIPFCSTCGCCICA